MTDGRPRVAIRGAVAPDAVVPGILVALSFLLYGVTVWLGSLSAVPGDGEGGSSAGSGVYPIAFLAYAAIGAFVVARRPEHDAGWLLCFTGFVAQVRGAASAAIDYAATPSGSAIPAWLLDPWLAVPLRNLWVVLFSALGLLLFVFPNGRVFSRAVASGLVLATFTIVVGLVTSGSATPQTEMRFPLFDALFSPEVADRLIGLGRATSGLSLVALLIFGAVSMVVRFRRARGIVRLQMKWFAYSAVVLAFVFAGTSVAFFVPPLRALDPGAPVPPAMFGGIPFLLALIAMPISAAVAILRYRLYDIDVLINRTLVYGALTLALAATYFGAVIVLQSALRPLTGGSEVAVALSTLAVVALVQPLRRRIQSAVDRRFFRSRYDAVRVLDAFSTRLRDEVDLDAVRRGLVDAVEHTVQPAHASVWLREPTR